MKSAEHKFYHARIKHREDVAPALWKIRIHPGGDFQFVAGQYATVGVRTAETMLERPYSIASSPYEKEIEFFIEAIPHGELTPLLHQLPVGSEVTLRKYAKGRFTLDLKGSHKNHLLLCTVTGIAPYVSYIRTLLKDWKENRFPADLHLYLIDGASRSWEFGYDQELGQVAAEVPWLTYVPTVSRPYEDSSWRGEVGRVEDIIRKYTDQWGLTGSDTIAYLCGHPQMIENSRGILLRGGFGKQFIKQEVFWVPGKKSQS